MVTGVSEVTQSDRSVCGVSGDYSACGDWRVYDVGSVCGDWSGCGVFVVTGVSAVSAVSMVTGVSVVTQYLWCL